MAFRCGEVKEGRKMIDEQWVLGWRVEEGVCVGER